MNDDFGTGLRNILALRLDTEVSLAEDPRGPGLDVGSALDSLIQAARDLLAGRTPSAPRGIILFFPPGRYLVPLRSGQTSSPYVFPENVQLFFSPGALLRPVEGVELVIHGTIRAGNQQIFGYERSAPLPGGVHDVNTVPMGRILLRSSLIPVVYPEWWGALPIDPHKVYNAIASRRDIDSSDALQAAIDAACVLRDDPDGGVRRPSIPVVLNDCYQCNETLTVECPPGAPDRNSSAVVQATRLTLGFARWRSPQAITSDDPHVRGGLSYRNSMGIPEDPIDVPRAPSKWHSCSKDPTNVGSSLVIAWGERQRANPSVKRAACTP